MKELKIELAQKLLLALKDFAGEKNLELSISIDDIMIETPPKPELGDVAFPMFPFARLLRMGPPQIAASMVSRLQEMGVDAEQAGPYVNARLDRSHAAGQTITRILQEGDTYGSNANYHGEKVMIEFSSPNTNKPLHLGHLRNNALGESVARVLKANGAQVRKVNLVNDRGVHICKSMLAYKELGDGDSPGKQGVKSDHFVGDYYVKYNEMASRDPDAEKRAQAMLNAWEAGDGETVDLWKTMNSWALEGLKETYERTGIHFDDIYYESNTYKLGREHVLKGLEDGVFFRDEEGTVWIDLEDIKLDKKVLLRKDGTSLYMTQDIGTAVSRHEDWPFERLIYVVAYEQNYHFRVLFHILKKLGFDWADKLYHLSYGMVNLPDGKMKSREGTVVDADKLLDELRDLALQEMTEKGRDQKIDDPQAVAEQVALGAIHYYLLQGTPSKDMVFNPAESLSFNGNTGPYLQYMGARISSMFRKYGKDLPSPESLDWKLLKEDEEWELVKLLASYPQAVEAAGTDYNPAHIASHLYELGKAFSRFYHEHPVLNCPDASLRDLRLYLAWAVKRVLMHGFHLINMPFLESM
ncbi:arginine--tRNA ligase [Salinispira pacifica]|uniref:Arginine--tRNA ligase n=1 Tax=Salinispira pacifica TaxID=1307761 RepID=V5WG58_9SPIO|nr:arginine--tRNA ligase [Salinispira pacifica]AHC14827.1 Arginyl-tRNA synthetase [Salinispira pacifica]